MNYATWTDEQLLSVRSKLLDWYIEQQRTNPRTVLLFIVGAILLFAAATGVYDVLMRGLHSIDLLLIAPGVVVVFLWRRHDKTRAANMEFLAEVNSELVRRGHEL